MVFVGGANAGSPIVDALLSRPSLFKLGVDYLLSNDLLDFRNADGTPCRVDIHDSGFLDLATSSGLVTALNQDAANRHPKESYRTLAGTSAGQFALGNLLLGVRPEDGVITKASANADFIGALESAQVPFDHLKMLDDTAVSLPQILQLLSR